ncbi:NVEALA domain-containing protein [Parabacteroides sp. OttesenSCG-928-G06]|nr:NVEALA domain-containing protein [Parabacteroides sp. OttesenSCG-928-K15]MDL2281755.1 NVEALA domain-containing protein [Parabacteroides sp. OttesenSCG-928-G06]
MKNKILGVIMVAAIAVAAGWNVYQNESKIMLSDLALENVDALAGGENPDREDCERANDICSEIVIYSDGDVGEDILLDHKKKPGWL